MTYFLSRHNCNIFSSLRVAETVLNEGTFLKDYPSEVQKYGECTHGGDISNRVYFGDVHTKVEKCTEVGDLSKGLYFRSTLVDKCTHAGDLANIFFFIWFYLRPQKIQEFGG